MREDEMTGPVVRVSIARCEPDRFAELAAMMAEAETALSQGIRDMPGLRDYFAGADEASWSLSNVSIWDSLEAARQMETFQPMLDLGHRFAEAGATFERPIMNYATLWQVSPANEPAE
jgi:hypothetical protein